MKPIIIALLNALIPLGISLLLLVRPQAFTRKDLKVEENAKLAGQLKQAGVVLLVAGILIFVSNLMTG